MCFYILRKQKIIYSIQSFFYHHHRKNETDTSLFIPVEILLSFYDVSVSVYVDSVLITYSACQLNFKFIHIDDFDLACHQIRPDNVMPLTLSDNPYTGGQSRLFLSYYQIEQFYRLRSLKLINIE